MTGALMEALGWAGAVLLVVAYGLVSWRRLNPRGTHYQALNVMGSALILANSAFHGAWPSIATNAFWMLVGLAVLVRPASASAR